MDELQVNMEIDSNDIICWAQMKMRSRKMKQEVMKTSGVTEKRRIKGEQYIPCNGDMRR